MRNMGGSKGGEACEDEVRECEARKSEATNNKAPPLLMKINEYFKNNTCDLNTYDLVFVTLHPYIKYIDFQRNQILSKVTDKVRRRMNVFFIVREPNETPEHYHYHIIGYLKKTANLNFKGIKTWIQKVEQYRMPEFYTNKYDMYQYANEEASEICNLTDTKIPGLNKLIYQNEMKQQSKDIAIKYAKTRRTQEQQLESIVRYMCKTNPEKLYEDYYVTPGLP